jgi:riboflavin kinase / FMN adenylyltransferase
VQVFETRKQLVDIVPGQVLIIGNFDGVHLGHQRLFEKARQTAKRVRTPHVAAMTFSPHPAAILYPDRNPGVLTPLDIKTNLLAQSGIDSLIVIKDSYEMLNLSPREFVEQFLMRHIRPSAIVEGPNFNFGYGRSGNVDTLADLGRQLGFEVVIVSPAAIDVHGAGSMMVSSSMVRRLLEEGNVSMAAGALGRPYRLIGRTVHGRGKGTEIGFPTANIEPEDQVIPAEGVYAARVLMADRRAELLAEGSALPAAISIGRAKTFVQDHALLIEAHLLTEGIGDLSGKQLAIDFVERVRNQQRFESIEALVEQIKKDCAQIRNILGQR